MKHLARTLRIVSAACTLVAVVAMMAAVRVEKGRR